MEKKQEADLKTVFTLIALSKNRSHCGWQMPEDLERRVVVLPDTLAALFHRQRDSHTGSEVCCRLIWSAGSPSAPYVDHMASVVVPFKPCCDAR